MESGKIQISDHGLGEGYVWVHFQETNVFSVYLTPNEPIQSFQDKVDRLEDAVLSSSGKVVVGGDFNARAVDWGMGCTDARGRDKLKMATRTGLAVLNVGSVSTFRRPGYSQTIPDVTFAS